MVIRVILVIAVLVVAILAYAASKPGTLHVTRTVTIHAAPEKIFPLINDLHNWSQWEEQEVDNPSLSRTYGDTPSGVGAACDWEAKGSAGKARMLITESAPNKRVVVQVDFERPFRAHNVNEFVLKPGTNATTVAWNWQGTNVFLLKVMSVFTNVDRMMGSHFETSLENLKNAAEK
jgi:uncharacterized protein YndB with AHSA1/START domain